MAEYCVALQPICDAQLRHIGDELLYRDHPDASGACIEDDTLATARVLNAVFFEAGPEALVGQRDIFFNAPRDWLLKPDLLPLPAHQVVVEVLENVVADESLIHSLQHMRSLGYRIALDDFVLNDSTRALLPLADIIKIDLRFPPSSSDLSLLGQYPLQLLAERVETESDFERCRQAGFDLFQGYFFARPQIHASTRRKRSSNKAIELKLMRRLNDYNVQIEDIEALIIQDPFLCLKLLNYVNSSALRRRHEVSSIRQALTLLGIRNVQRLVMTIILADNSPSSRLLLPLALMRAALCERLALHLMSPYVCAQSAFTVGFFSMMDRLLDQPLEQVLSQVRFAQNVRTAITDEAGPLGSILHRVRLFEQARTDELSSDMVQRMNEFFIQAQRWTQSILSVVDSDDGPVAGL